MQFNLLVAPHYYLPGQASSVQITCHASLQTYIENPPAHYHANKHYIHAESALRTNS